MSAKWKKVKSGRSLWNRLNRKSDIPRPTIIALVVLFVAVLFLSTTAIYYYLYAATGTKPGGPLDPFTTLWNGQTKVPVGSNARSAGPAYLTGNRTSGTTYGVPTADAGKMGCGDPCTAAITPMFEGDTIIVSIYGMTTSGLGNTYTVSDTGGNTYAQLAQYQLDGTDFDLEIEVWSAVQGTSYGFDDLGNGPDCGAFECDTITVDRTAGSMGYTFFASDYAGVKGLTSAGSCSKNQASGTSISCEAAIASISYDNWVLVENTIFVADGTSEVCVSPTITTDANATTFTNPTTISSITFRQQDQFSCDTGFIKDQGTLSDTSWYPATDQTFNVTTTYTGLVRVKNQLSVFTLLSPNNDETQCMPGYECWFTRAWTNGTITLQANPYSQAVALSKDKIDMSAAVAKQLAFFESWWENPCTGSGSCSNPNFNLEAGTSWGFFMTDNGTMPMTADWSPLADPSVKMATVLYYAGFDGVTSKHIWHINIYFARKPGQLLLADSGLGADPTPSSNIGQSSCSTSGTLYICAQNREAMPGTSYSGFVGPGGGVTGKLLPISIGLNFTGAGVSGQTETSKSYLCWLTVGGSNCQAGGAGNTEITWSSGTYVAQYILPWMLVQGNNYHMGFWTSKAHGVIDYSWISWGSNLGASPAGTPEGNALFAGANVISIFIPPASALNPNLQEGGFFGWLGGALGATWNTITGAVGAAVEFIAPVFSIGNALMGALIGALIQAFTYLVKGLEILLNAIGSIFGFGTIGTVLVSFFSAIAALITGFVATALGWFVNTINTVVALAAVVTNILANGFWTILVNYIAGPILTFLGFIWTVLTIFFSYSVASSYVLMLDWLFGMLQVWMNGVRGFVRWINFNLMMFVKFFKFMYFLLTEAVNVILKIVGTLRGSGTGTGAPV